jgi:hypothetical protein
MFSRKYFIHFSVFGTDRKYEENKSHKPIFETCLPPNSPPATIFDSLLTAIPPGHPCIGTQFPLPPMSPRAFCSSVVDRPPTVSPYSPTTYKPSSLIATTTPTKKPSRPFPPKKENSGPPSSPQFGFFFFFFFFFFVNSWLWYLALYNFE